MPTDPGQIELLFHAASTRPEEERADFVMRESGGDEGLRDQVLALLRADVRAESCPIFAEPVGIAFAIDAVDRALPALAAGTVVGTYTILEQLGEGGFGLVYLAERRSPMVQRVALKVIRPGMDSRAVLRRFEFERRALAAMNHPGIAGILDAGATAAGLPYFVMEYIAGVRITAYCRDRSLTLHQRLRLFAEVCRAVQHAHSKGIIHRDIKPDNILVTETDGRATPKVIDFGIARVLDAGGWGGSDQTDQAPSVGTPIYMSPEQASLGQQDIDARTDVYSLGVVLYELLAGVPPFDPHELRRIGFDAARRIIREVEPPLPRARARQAGHSTSEPAVGGPQPHPQSDLVPPREVEWIPLKAMRKNRDDRYDTPAAFADDIENFLAGRVLVAGPQSRGYRASKFIVRNRWPLALAAITALAIIAFGVSSALARHRERRLLLEAQAARAEARVEAEHALAEAYNAGIAAAASALQTGDAFSARSRLQSIDPSRRAWEWGFLWRQSDQSERAFVGHSRAIVSARFSPDGSVLASGSLDLSARLWDMASGRQLARFDGFGGGDRVCVAFSPRGDELFAAGCDGILRVFSTTTYRPLRELKLAVPVGQLEVSDDGACLFVLDRTDGAFEIRQADTGKLISRACKGAVSFAIFPDGTRAAVGVDGRVEIVRIPGGAIIGSVPVPGGRPVDVAVSARGDRVSAALHLSRVLIVDATTLAVVGDWPDARASGPARFVAHDSMLVVGGINEGLRAWRIANEQPMGEWTAPGLNHRVVDVSANGSWLLSGSADGQLRLWPAERASTWIPEGMPRSRTSFALSADGRRIVYGSDESSLVAVFNVATRRQSGTIDAGGAGIVGATFGRTPDELFTADVKGVRRVDLATGRSTALFEAPARFRTLSLSPDGHTLAVGDRPDRTVLIDPDTGISRTFGTPERGRAVVFSPDGRTLLCDLDGALRSVDPVDGNVIVEFSSERNEISFACFSPNGRLVAATSWDQGPLRVWNASTGALLTSIKSTDTFFTPIFLPDGSRLLAGDEAGRVRAWDTSTWHQALSWRVSASWCLIALDSSGHTLIGNSEGVSGFAVRILDAPSLPPVNSQTSGK